MEPAANMNHQPSTVSPSIHGLTLHELETLCSELGQPRYRADQAWDWLYGKLVADWDAMTNLPPALRGDLASRLSIHSALAAETQGKPGRTRKILAALPDGERVEEVIIPARDRRTVCVSSQVGCRFGCTFCASGQAGFRRDLEPGEMVGQVVLAARLLGKRPTNVVFMGIGEPFDNYDAVLKAVRIINDGRGLAIGARRITISTCGIIPGIERLAGEGLQIELSVSLHAADDATRSALMPVNRKYALDDLLDACRRYTDKTGRIITFEYTLVRGVNDAPEQAGRLAERLSGLRCRVNLIPLSAVEEFGHSPSPEPVARMFVEALSAAGINATLRASKGAPLKAACGQLRFTRRG